MKRIALVSDEWHPINKYVQEWLDKRGFGSILFGSYLSKIEEPWVEVTAAAARSVAAGVCDEGIFFCWSGTGACIVANKVPKIRAALCNDPETAGLARVWNHANVLVLSNRSLKERDADLILAKWFEEYDNEPGLESVNKINKLERP